MSGHGSCSEPAGIYIHVPFCREKCRYCDFYSITDIALTEDYLAAVTAEIGRSGSAGTPVDTVYVGGGTPSLLGPSGIGRLIDCVATVFSVTSGAEVSIELNPGTVGPGDMAGYAAAGVNRLTIGVQSFSDRALAFLGRIHSAVEAADAIGRARAAGFDNLGLDLIYCLPDQRPEQWATDLATAISFSPEHISCYMLTAEPGTPLGRDRVSGRFTPLNDDRSSALFLQARRTLGDAGYCHYEISNFSRSAATMSRHNRKYWTGVPYFGVGPSAHSFLPPVRRWNRSDVRTYIDAIKTGVSPVAGRERLTREQSMVEAVMLGLRQMAGIDIQRFNDAYETDFLGVFASSLRAPGMQRLLQIDARSCRLTENGMLVMDAVVGRMVACIY